MAGMIKCTLSCRVLSAGTILVFRIKREFACLPRIGDSVEVLDSRDALDPYIALVSSVQFNTDHSIEVWVNEQNEDEWNGESLESIIAQFASQGLVRN